MRGFPRGRRYGPSRRVRGAGAIRAEQSSGRSDRRSGVRKSKMRCLPGLQPVWNDAQATGDSAGSGPQPPEGALGTQAGEVRQHPFVHEPFGQLGVLSVESQHDHPPDPARDPRASAAHPLDGQPQRPGRQRERTQQHRPDQDEQRRDEREARARSHVGECRRRDAQDRTDREGNTCCRRAARRTRPAPHRPFARRPPPPAAFDSPSGPDHGTSDYSPARCRYSLGSTAAAMRSTSRRSSRNRFTRSATVRGLSIAVRWST